MSAAPLLSMSAFLQEVSLTTDSRDLPMQVLKTEKSNRSTTPSLLTSALQAVQTKGLGVGVGEGEDEGLGEGEG